MTDFKNNCERRDKRKKQIEELITTAVVTVLAIALLAVLQTVSVSL